VQVRLTLGRGDGGQGSRAANDWPPNRHSITSRQQGAKGAHKAEGEVNQSLEEKKAEYQKEFHVRTEEFLAQLDIDPENMQAVIWQLRQLRLSLMALWGIYENIKYSSSFNWRKSEVDSTILTHIEMGYIDLESVIGHLSRAHQLYERHTTKVYGKDTEDAPEGQEAS
jgi:hypothetical protein